MSSQSINTPASVSIFVGFIETAKGLHKADARWRYVTETGLMGLILMTGLALFGGGSASGASGGNNTGSYNPPSASAPAQSAPSTQPNSPPAVTQQQLNAIKNSTGAGKVVSLVPLAPTVIAPISQDQIKVDSSTKPTADEDGVVKHQDFGPKPVN